MLPRGRPAGYEVHHTGLLWSNGDHYRGLGSCGSIACFIGEAIGSGCTGIRSVDERSIVREDNRALGRGTRVQGSQGITVGIGVVEEDAGRGRHNERLPRTRRVVSVV